MENAAEVIRKVLDLCNYGLQADSSESVPDVFETPTNPNIIGDFEQHARKKGIFEKALQLLLATGEIKKESRGKDTIYVSTIPVSEGSDYITNGIQQHLIDREASEKYEKQAAEDEKRAAEDARKAPFAEIDEKRRD